MAEILVDYIEHRDIISQEENDTTLKLRFTPSI